MHLNPRLTVLAVALFALAAPAAGATPDDGGRDVTGKAQPLATGVAVTASDGTDATPAVDAAPAPGAAPAKKPAIKLSGLKAPKHVWLETARHGRLKASFIVPTGARFVRVSLSRRAHAALLLIVPAATEGARQTVPLTGAKARKLVRGRYTITVGAGATKTQLGSPVLRGAVTVR